MTRRYASHEIRALLRKNPDGLTLSQILDEFPEMTRTNVRRVVQNLPDAYIDRWEVSSRRAYRAVWCVVIPPPHCPRPPSKRVRSYE
jgi:hypothetical protein